jgi:hypothetical protein
MSARFSPRVRDDPTISKHAVYALDATNIELCLSVFPRGYQQTGQAGVKLNTC